MTMCASFSPILVLEHIEEFNNTLSEYKGGDGTWDIADVMTLVHWAKILI